MIPRLAIFDAESIRIKSERSVTIEDSNRRLPASRDVISPMVAKKRIL